MEIVKEVRGGTIRITGITFADTQVTIIKNGEPFTAVTDKNPEELSFPGRVNFDNAKWLLGIVWTQYCALARQGISQVAMIPPEAKRKAQEALEIDNATMLNIEKLQEKWREEDERIAEEKRKEELVKEPERALIRAQQAKERDRALTAAYIARYWPKSD